MAPYLLVLSVLAFPPDAGPPVPSTVSGHVVDQNGAPVAGYDLMFSDTHRLTGQVIAGCATFHPQQHVTTGADGSFDAGLPFTPNEVFLDDAPHGYEPRTPPEPLDPSKPIELRVYRVPRAIVNGSVVDPQGAPVAGASLGGNYGSALSDDAGHFTLETRTDKPASVRIRKMGFKPLDVPPDALEHVVLKVRRTLLTVKVLDPKTKQPVHGLRVSAFAGDDLVSYCTAGDVDFSHEPNPGECTLDADPGSIELRAGATRRKLKVAGDRQSVTLEAEEKTPR